VAPGADLRCGLALHGFPDFGLYLFRSERLYLAIRCGAIGLNGRGAHAHNDQLAIELAIDGADWIRDPGSYVYTASRRWRDAYRSVTAHAAPHWPGREPGRLDLAPFWLGDEAKARCLRFDRDGFIGEHQGYGTPVRRTLRVEAERILVLDEGLPLATDDRIELVGREATAAHFAPAVPYSPGYGKRWRHG
jgi:hypothetical protein